MELFTNVEKLLKCTQKSWKYPRKIVLYSRSDGPEPLESRSFKGLLLRRIPRVSELLIAKVSTKTCVSASLTQRCAVYEFSSSASSSSYRSGLLSRLERLTSSSACFFSLSEDSVKTMHELIRYVPGSSRTCGTCSRGIQIEFDTELFSNILYVCVVLVAGFVVDVYFSADVDVIVDVVVVDLVVDVDVVVVVVCVRPVSAGNAAQASALLMRLLHCRKFGYFRLASAPAAHEPIQRRDRI